jgi:hypothetical protein
MKTEIRIYRTNVKAEDITIEMSADPSYKEIKEKIMPLIGEDCEHIEHVAVLFRGQRHDMFVDEIGAMATTKRPPLPINKYATEIYLNASRSRGDFSVETRIHGTAVLILNRLIWS